MISFELLKTEVAVAHQVLLGRAVIETLIPSKRGHVQAIVTRADGTVEPTIHGWNARTNAGASAQANNMCGTPVAAFAYLALSTTSLTVAMNDTALSGEIVTNGLGRVLATFGSYVAPVSVGGSASFTISYTFNATGSSTVQSCALFNAAASGTMFSEINLTSQAVLNSGDSLTIIYTIQI